MKKLSDTALVNELQSLVGREREIVIELLRYLREVEKRKIFLSRGHSSLFAFCTAELGYSEPEAMLRIQSMRLLRTIPEVAGLMGRGKLSMSVAAQIQCASRRESLPRDQIRNLVHELKGASKRDAEKKLVTLFPNPPPPERKREVSEDLVEIRFTIDKAQAEKFERLLDHRSHTNFERKLAVLFSGLVDEELSRLEARQKPKEFPSEDASPQAPALVERRDRYVPVEIRRKVFARDGGICQYQDPVSKRFCHSRHGLQLDHILPYSRGGEHSTSNLRLFCGAHNRWRNKEKK